MAHDYDLVIIGMGSGGLTAAKFAASLNLRVAAIERDRVGGDCLWTGCVPSKALLASAKVAQRMRTADSYGLTAVDPEIDRNAVWERIRRIQHEIAAAEDNAEHYEQLGVEVVLGTAQLAGPHSVRVGSRTLDTKFVLLCTGSRPAVPPIEGLEATGYLTSENIFELEDVPSSFVVIGGGPIAVELAQGLNRLDADVQVLQAPPRILAREEPELSDTLTGVLELEGVRIALGARAERISRDGSSKVVTGTADGSATEWRADDRRRTSVRSIYATGDVAGNFQFTHWAGYESALAVRDMFFPGKAKYTNVVPWCTFTDPELARVGLTEEQAVEQHGRGKVRIDRIGLDESDRARADGSTTGAIICVSANDKLVGAHVLAVSGGDVIQELSQAVHEGRSLGKLAEYVHAYPTIATSINLLAAERRYEEARRWAWLIRR